MLLPDISWIPPIRYREVSAELVTKAVVAFQEHDSANRWSAWIDWRGRFRMANLSPGLVGVLLHAHIKPPVARMAVIRLHDGRVFKPTEIADDLVEVCHEARSVTLPEMVVLHEFCQFNYGLVQKRVPPIMVESESDLTSIGLDPTSTPLPSEQGVSLWWQKWQGELFQVGFSDKPGKPFFRIKWLRAFAGKYKRRHFWST